MEGKKPLESNLLACGSDCTAEDSPMFVAPALGLLMFGDIKREDSSSACTATGDDAPLSADSR